MLDFGFSEILLTSAIALVVLGPERLPKVARQVGNWMGRARAMARQLSEQLEREVSAEELLKDQMKPRAPMANLLPPQYEPPQYVAPAAASPFVSPDPHTPLPDPYVPHPPVGDPQAVVAGQPTQAEPCLLYTSCVPSGFPSPI